MLRTTKKYIDSEYGQVHIRQTPSQSSTDAVPLMCLHQSPKSSLEFETFMQTASATRDVISFDYPGYGMSCPPPSQNDATIELYARTAWAVADALELDKVDVIGYHTGSSVGVEMAATQASRVGQINMISATLFSDEEIDFFEKMFTPTPLDHEGTRLTKTWQRIVERQGPGVTLEMLDRSFYQSLMGGENYEWGHTAVFSYVKKLRKNLASLEHKIIILNPADDLTNCTRRAEEHLRNGKVIEMPDWGYGLLDVYPNEILDLIA